MIGLGYQELLVGVLVLLGLIGGVAAVVYLMSQRSRPSGATQALNLQRARGLGGGSTMDAAATQLAIERAKAEKKNPAVLWLVNIVWPGLGNIVVGQTPLGILFGLLQWVCIGIFIVTFGFGGILLLINWVVASAVGHSRINRDYSEALARIQTGATS